jgi:hypothetical protein
MADVSLIDADTLTELVRTSHVIFKSITHLFMVKRGVFPFPASLGMDPIFVQGTRSMNLQILSTVSEKNSTILGQIREVNPSYGTGVID